VSTTIQFPKNAFSREANKLSLLKKEVSQKTLKGEGKLFVRDCIAMTPPIGPHPIQEFSNSQGQRRRGEKAVSRDIDKQFASAKSLKILTNPQNKKLDHDLEKAIKYGRIAEVEAILKSVGLNFTDHVALEATEEYHKANRDSRGRVKGFRQFILRTQSIERVRKKAIEDVGEAKGAWCKAAAALGLALPNWITRHSGGPGLYQDNSDDQLNPSITIGNLIDWAQQFEGRIGIVESALQLRVSSMKKRIEILIKKGY
jgi:hypothetical protein